MKLFLQLFLSLHVNLYRLTNGKFGGHMNGGDVLLLTTIGRKSGKERVMPVMYLKDGEDYLVVASASGAPKHPGWYWNAAKGTAPVHIQVDDKKMEVSVVDTEGEERDKYYARFKEAIDSFTSYEQKANRTIPVLKLSPKS